MSTYRAPFVLVALLGMVAGCASHPAESTSSDEVIAATDPCEGLTAEGVSDQARSFMAEQKMIRSGEEQDLVVLGMHLRWEAISLVQSSNHCLVLMNVVSRIDPSEGTPATVSNTDAYDVVALERVGGDLTAFKFEDVIAVPKTVRAVVDTGIADDDRPGFFAEFTGPSAVEVMKSVLVHPYPGFAGVAVKAGKAEFDDTPGRTWQTANATFSMRRGSSAEALDMYAYQLDSDFDGYFSAGVTVASPVGVGVSVAPWNNRIKKILE